MTVNGEKMIYSQIYEEQPFICSLSPLEIIKDSCTYYGCSYRGKREGASLLMGFNQKVPIAIDDLQGIYFFPTHSPNNDHCIWISYHHVLDKKELGQNELVITFRNLQQLNVNVSLHSFNNQMLRSHALQTRLQHNRDASKEGKQIRIFLKGD